jgi:Uncharacterized protein conserved in bacteria (DUF2188)
MNTFLLTFFQTRLYVVAQSRSSHTMWCFGTTNKTMANTNKHVVKHPDGWAVRPAGGSKPSRVVETQQQAIEIARQQAIKQGTEMFIHGRNGQIRERNTYGDDPHPPEG